MICLGLHRLRLHRNWHLYRVSQRGHDVLRETINHDAACYPNVQLDHNFKTPTKPSISGPYATPGPQHPADHMPSPGPSGHSHPHMNGMTQSYPYPGMPGQAAPPPPPALMQDQYMNHDHMSTPGISPTHQSGGGLSAQKRKSR